MKKGILLFVLVASSVIGINSFGSKKEKVAAPVTMSNPVICYGNCFTQYVQCLQNGGNYGPGGTYGQCNLTYQLCLNLCDSAPPQE